MTQPILYIDFETRSPVDLKKYGLARYARDPLTEALMLAWAMNDEQVWLAAQKDNRIYLPPRAVEHVESGGLVVAHNAQFELAIWNHVMVKRYGWPKLKIEQVRCTMAAAYAMALPGALEDTAHALGLTVAKDSEGRALMLKMCKPKADGTYFDTPEARVRLGEYCKTDVSVEREIFKRVLPLSEREQRLWVLDQHINLRGVPFDMPSIKAAIDVAAQEKERLNAEMNRVTEGVVAVCSNIGKLKDWAADFGVMPPSLAKAELAELLGEEILPDEVEEALRLRQAAGRFTSISKLDAITNRQIDGRVRYVLQYHAATTGRWAGRGIQPHNFPRDLPKPREVEEILACLREGRVRWLDIAYNEPSIMISKCLRGFMHAAPGQVLMGGDYASVEGRGIAWLAGEEWKLEAYREIDADPTLPDMYKRAYAVTFGIDPRAVTKEQRQVGKVEDLAFGYQGGVGAFRTMGKGAKILVVEKITPKLVAKAKAMGGQIFTEDQADSFKRGWRDGHPAIVQYWWDLQDAARDALRAPGRIIECGPRGREVRFRVRGSFLWCRLPSGRTLCYPYPQLADVNGRETVTFKGQPDALVWGLYQKQKLNEEPNTTYIVDAPGNTSRWCRVSTYGGKLSENVTQALCRDILAEAMTRVEAAGFKVVVHVHDEIIVEGVHDEQDRERFERIMTEVPVWAEGFPISAGCWLSPRYIKDD